MFLFLINVFNTAHPFSNYSYMRYFCSWLGLGALTAHGRTCLSLLRSRPDEVHKFPLRKTHSSSPLAKARPYKNNPKKGIHPCYSGLQVQGTATSPASTATLL